MHAGGISGVPLGREKKPENNNNNFRARVGNEMIRGSERPRRRFTTRIIFFRVLASLENPNIHCSTQGRVEYG
jgi:hypothetical protein